MGQGQSMPVQPEVPPRVKLPTHLFLSERFNDQASYIGALKDVLKIPDSPKGQRVVAVAHMIGDCNVGKSQHFNIIASCLKGRHVKIRQVGTFIRGTHQQCSIHPDRYRASDSDQSWKVENDGEMYIHDHRGAHDFFHLQILKLSTTGKLKPTEGYPLEPSANDDRAKIDKREPESATASTAKAPG